jgi:purine nucleosidase
MNRLILDTDGGIDDAQALLLLIANGRAPAAVTTVFGNVDLDAATRNVLAT